MIVIFRRGKYDERFNAHRLPSVIEGVKERTRRLALAVFSGSAERVRIRTKVPAVLGRVHVIIPEKLSPVSRRMTRKGRGICGGR
jgi:hypothetical protein